MINSELEKIAYVYGDVCVRRKKQRRKRQKLLVIELLFDYAKNSTLHGLRYIVDQALNIVERCFWFLTVIVSIGLCAYYIFNVVYKWKTSPVIVTVNGRLSSVGSVPFPAVTICPQMKINPYNYNYTEKWQLLQNNTSLQVEQELLRFRHVAVLCDEIETFEHNFFGRNFTNSSMADDIKMASGSHDDFFYMCNWNWNNTYNRDCKKLFSRVLTEEGVCYTFNSLAAQDMFKESVQSQYQYTESETPLKGWSAEHGYNETFDKEYFPRRGRGFGSDPDLRVILENDPYKKDESCNKIFSGYKIYLHHPTDLPQASLYYYAALPNQLSSVAISFHEMNSDDGLINYDANIRQCYFPSERNLRYFKTYTAKNCFAECLSNYTFRVCGCVGYYMPFHNSSEICFPTIRKLVCMSQAKDLMVQEERKFDRSKSAEGCSCLPACDTTEYDAEILKTDFRLQNLIAKYKYLFENYKPTNTYSEIDLFYKQPRFVTMQRRELFGVTDLLANIGGLLGLFLGFSFLSLIEIIYFITFRVGFILKRDLEEEKANEKNKIEIKKN